MRHSASFACAAALLLGTACGSSPSTDTEETAAAPAPAAAPTAPSSQPASPHGGVSNAHGAAPTAPGVPAVPGKEEAGGLAFHAPSPFVQRVPGSRMRAAEYALASNPESPLTVFFFGPGQGGAVDANIQRWVGQFSQPDGTPSAQRATITPLDRAGLKVTRIQLTGTFGSGMAMPGRPAAPPATDHMLLGAIAEGPQGPVFFKWTGPKALLEANVGAFEGLIESMKPVAP